MFNPEGEMRDMLVRITADAHDNREFIMRKDKNIPQNDRTHQIIGLLRAYEVIFGREIAAQLHDEGLVKQDEMRKSPMYQGTGLPEKRKKSCSKCRDDDDENAETAPVEDLTLVA